jgi:hypothetical protein
MKPTDAILAHVNGKLGRYELFRELLAHDDWRVPRPEGASLPTVMVADAAMTPSIWAFSSEEAYQAACKAVNAAAIGRVERVSRLEELLIEDDPRVVQLVIDPSFMITFRIQTDELASFRRMARAVGVERAIKVGDYKKVLSYDRYAVPYFGVLGQGHNLITMPSERGNMLAAFTAADAIDAFLAVGSESDRQRVKFAIIDGAQLFGTVHQLANGVLMNPMGPRTFGFELPTCRDIANAV